MTYSARDRSRRLKRINPGVRSPQIWELDRTDEGSAATITYTRWDERYLVEVPGDTPRVFNRWINAAAMALFLVDSRTANGTLPPAIPPQPYVNTPKVRKLGSFQRIILAEVQRLGTRANPTQITKDLAASLRPTITYAQVFLALQALKGRGHVSTISLSPEDRPLWCRKYVYRLEEKGKLALEQARVNDPKHADGSDQ